jgi:hypothetical protein
MELVNEMWNVNLSSQDLHRLPSTKVTFKPKRVIIRNNNSIQCNSILIYLRANSTA